MKKRFRGLAQTVAIVALVVLGGAAMWQDNLIYFPETPPASSVFADARRHGLTPWPDENGYRGLLREPVGPARGTLVLFHGNAGHAGQRDWYADEFARLGLRVILAEYPGYGSRTGAVGEATMVADAAETLAMARERFPGPLLVVGESLGAGVAAAVSGDAAALLLITPWDSLANVARHHYPWLPVGLLLRDRYDSVANLAGYRGRVAVVIAERDSIVPPDAGRRLYERLGEPKRLWTVPLADHNDWMASVDDAWWRTVVAFLLGDY